jgi:hypothetical protein
MSVTKVNLNPFLRLIPMFDVDAEARVARKMIVDYSIDKDLGYMVSVPWAMRAAILKDFDYQASKLGLVRFESPHTLTPTVEITLVTELHYNVTAEALVVPTQGRWLFGF